MTTLKNLRGKTIQNFTSDPSDDTEGQVWYNTTAGAFKSVVALAAWSSGSPLNTARGFIGGFGTQTEALAFGGSTPYVAATEEYNGSGWSNGGNLNTTRSPYAKGGFGIQTAAVAVGGYTSTTTTNSTEKYDGTSWTASTNYPASYLGIGGAGTQTTGLAFGGAPTNPYPGQTTTNEFDGTSWTAGGSMGSGRATLGAAGTQTTGLGFGGFPNGPASGSNATEEYDGSTWTSSNNMPISVGGLAGFGTQTSAISAGGSTSSYFASTGLVTTTMSYDGTNWTTTPANMGTTRGALGGAGANSNSGLAFGGRNVATAYVSTTEEYNVSSSIITAAAWAAGGNMTTGRNGLGGAGIQTAAIAFGGNQATPVTPANPFMVNTEEYNGSSWSPGGNMGTGRANIGAAGTQTATLGFGGLNATTAINSVEEYDGSTWSPGGLMNTATPYSRVGAGTQTAALGYGGAVYSGPGTFAVSNVSEEYNGSSWTSTPNMNTARYVGAGGGTVSAALSAGGYAGPDYSSATEEYNGSTWTTVNPLPQKLNSQGFSGNQTAGLFFGGEFPSVPSSNIINSISYDGTNYSTAPNLGTGRRALSGAGTQTAGLAFGGVISPQPAPVGNVASTEEFNGETTALNFKTITTS